MRHRFILLILAITCICSCGRRGHFRTGKAAKDNDKQISLIRDLERTSGYLYMDTDSTYTSFAGKGITIQNSYPKGGNIEPDIPYTDATGKSYFYVGFWTRVINGTHKTLEFKVNFPADSFPLSSPSDSYLKLFIPKDTMTVDKLRLYNYGLTKMKSFVDTNWNNASTLQKNIKPNEEHMFYTVALAYHAGGPARSGIILKKDQLFYRITMGSHGSLEIPCGKITFKNKGDD